MGIKSSKKRAAPEHKPGSTKSSPAPNYRTELDGVAGAADETIAELQRLLEYRSLMLASIAHDLRTPLTAILGFAEILVDFEKLTEPQKGFCERIQNSGRELQSTINLLSDLSRLELHDTTVVLCEFPLSLMLQELCSSFSRQAEKKKISLACRVGEGVSRFVADESKLRQMLYNVLACAIARSPFESQVNFTASVNRKGELAVKIEDEGEFVDATRGFEVFGAGAVGDNPTLQGIGLDISRRLAAALGGTITFAKRKPRGLSILLQLPAGNVGGPLSTSG